MNKPIVNIIGNPNLIRFFFFCCRDEKHVPTTSCKVEHITPWGFVDAIELENRYLFISILGMTPIDFFFWRRVDAIIKFPIPWPDQFFQTMQQQTKVIQLFRFIAPFKRLYGYANLLKQEIFIFFFHFSSMIIIDVWYHMLGSYKNWINCLDFAYMRIIKWNSFFFLFAVLEHPKC